MIRREGGKTIITPPRADAAKADELVATSVTAPATVEVPAAAAPVKPTRPAPLPDPAADADAASDAAASAAADTVPAADADEPAAAPSAAVASAPAQARNGFAALLLIALTLVVWMAWQGWLLVKEREALQQAHAAQQPAMDNAAKARETVHALATDVQRLAAAGNANARLLVDELKKRGVTFNQDAPAQK